ncbi:MAG: galactokinase family protein [Bacilli bacterium]
MFNKNEIARLKKLKDTFYNSFGMEPGEFIRSCGRLEIIGNHLDYNGGHVMNASVENLCILGCAAKMHDKIVIRTEGYDDIILNLNDLEYSASEKETSVAIVKGICNRLKELGYKLDGICLQIDSNIPNGGGVSSSAAFGVLVCKILSVYYNKDELTTIDIAKIVRFAENNYFGKGSGLQDEIGCCSKGFSITDYYDQANPIVTTFNTDLGKYKFLIINTLSSHSDSTKDFDMIVSEMKEIAHKYGEEYLINVDYVTFLNDFKDPQNGSQRKYKRAYHFFNENKRVLEAYDVLKENDIASFLKLFEESGLSSENNLQSIIAEGQTTNNLRKVLDLGREIIVDGAIRVHGGGFGGTALVLINEKEINSFKLKMSKLVPVNCIYEVELSKNPLLVSSILRVKM